MSVATQKNASYDGNVPYGNFVLTANNCYRCITCWWRRYYPPKKWNVEFSRDEINEYTNAIHEQLNRGGKDSLDSLIESFLGKKRNDASNTVNDRKVKEFNDRVNGLYEGRKPERTSDNTEGNDSFGKSEYGTGFIKTGADGANFPRYISVDEAEEPQVLPGFVRVPFSIEMKPYFSVKEV